MNGGPETAYRTVSYHTRGGTSTRQVSREVWRNYYRKWTVEYDQEQMEGFRKQKQKEFWDSIQFEEDITPYREKTDKISSLGSAPFTKPFWITFGVGDDAGTYAPAQYVKLVKIDYGLSPRKLRTLTLHFVPSAGLMGLEAQPELLEVLRGTNQVEYQAEVTLFNQDKSKAKSPIVAIPELITRAYSKALGVDTEVEYLTFELETFIRKKFSEAAISVYQQDLKSGMVNPTTAIGVPGALFAGPAAPPSAHIKAAPPVAGKEAVKVLANYLVKTLPSGSGGASTSNAGTIFREDDNHRKIMKETEDLDYTKHNEVLIRFYTKVCKLFYKSLGLEYRCWFTDIDGNKISYLPFDRKLAETNSTSMRNFVRDRRHAMEAKISIKGRTVAGKPDPSPAGLSRAIKVTLATLNGTNKPPILINYPEEDFLTKWHTANGTQERKHNNVVFLVTPALYSALVKGYGNKYVKKLKGINTGKLQKFVDTYAAFFRSSPTIGRIEGLHDPYAYLSAKSRMLGSERLLVTDDQRGKITSTAQLEKHLRENKIPLFVYGFKNSNVLDFKFDLKMWYAQFLRLIPQSLRNSMLSTALIDPNNPKGLLPLALALDLIKSDKSGEALEKYLDAMWDDAEEELVAAKGGSTRSTRQNPFNPNINATQPFGGTTTGSTATQNATLLLNTADFATGSNKQNERAQEEYFSQTWTDEKTVNALRASVLPPRDEFKARIKKLLLLILNEEAYSPRINVQSSEDSKMLGVLNSVQDRLQSQGGFRGTITTLPLFQIMSPTMIGRSSILYMVESQVYSNAKLNNSIPYKTWLSGEYWILGYEGIIEKGKVTSSFDIVKKPYLRNVTIEE